MTKVGLKSPESPKTERFDQHKGEGMSSKTLTDGRVVVVGQSPREGDLHGPIGDVEATS